MTGDEVVVGDDDATRADAFAVRREVFVEEQGVPADLEWDDHDERAVHFVAYDGGRAVGAARLRRFAGSEGGCKSGDFGTADRGDVGKVERVAVLPDARGSGWGRRLMEAVERAAADRGVAELTLSSQTHAEAFYRRLGYETVSDVFREAGIPHVKMVKSIEVVA
ncbi:GNAT family N-acetyltransferase [Halegenticoccus tardaugens]|uniref:GNAT family N-acetyltransferase n=1 Tax=Halegenticoccus tardaugens TaxID=2071624 RepID=UPI00100AC97C|nr:GNAT family N-acetyltransferase [Halegenticoccus tardaugens]